MVAPAVAGLVRTAVAAGGKKVAEEAAKKTGSTFLQQLGKNTLDSLVPNLLFSSAFPILNIASDPSVLSSEEGRNALMRDVGISIASAGIGAGLGGLGQTTAARFFPGKYVTGIKPEVTKTFDDLNSITGKAKVAPVNFDSSKRDIGLAYRNAKLKLNPSDAQKLDDLLPSVNSYVDAYINDGKRLMERTHVPSQIPLRIGQGLDVVGSIGSSMGLYSMMSGPQAQAADPQQFEQLLNQGQYNQDEIIAQQLLDRYGGEDQFARAPGTMSQLSTSQPISFEELLNSAVATPQFDEAMRMY